MRIFKKLKNDLRVLLLLLKLLRLRLLLLLLLLLISDFSSLSTSKTITAIKLLLLLPFRTLVIRQWLLLLTWRCPWCNGYRRRKWTRRLEFKSWTRMIAFHIALIPLGKVWIHLFSLQLWVNSRTDWVLQPWWGN